MAESGSGKRSTRLIGGKKVKFQSSKKKLKTQGWGNSSVT